MKMANVNFKKFSSKPIELELRNLLSIQFNPYELDNLKKHILNKENLEIYNDNIANLLNSKFY